MIKLERLLEPCRRKGQVVWSKLDFVGRTFSSDRDCSMPFVAEVSKACPHVMICLHAPRSLQQAVTLQLERKESEKRIRLPHSLSLISTQHEPRELQDTSQPHPGSDSVPHQKPPC